MVDIEDFTHELSPSWFEYAEVTPVHFKYGHKWVCKEEEAELFVVELVSKCACDKNTWVCNIKDKHTAHAIADKLQAWIDGIYA